MPAPETATNTMWSFAVAKAYVTKNAGAGAAHDSQIIMLADAVSSRIENYIRRMIVKRVGVIEILDGTRSNKISLPTYPVVSVEEIKIRTSMLEPFPATGIDASAFELDTKHGIVYLLAGLTPGGYYWDGKRTIRISFTPGFDVKDGPAIPRDLYGMGLDYVKFLYQRWANDLVITQNVSDAGKNLSVPNDLPKDLRDTFAYHIKRRI
jgi:hypothetical protein